MAADLFHFPLGVFHRHGDEERVLAHAALFVPDPGNGLAVSVPFFRALHPGDHGDRCLLSVDIESAELLAGKLEPLFVIQPRRMRAEDPAINPLHRTSHFLKWKFPFAGRDPRFTGLFLKRPESDQARELGDFFESRSRFAAGDTGASQGEKEKGNSFCSHSRFISCDGGG